MLNCTRCGSTGFLNLPDDIEFSRMDNDDILEFINGRKDEYPDTTVCDCCGNGDDTWYGTPGEHYNSEDPIGKNGPYAYNGGLCECH